MHGVCVCVCDFSDSLSGTLFFFSFLPSSQQEEEMEKFRVSLTSASLMLSVDLNKNICPHFFLLQIFI